MKKLLTILLIIIGFTVNAQYVILSDRNIINNERENTNKEYTFNVVFEIDTLFNNITMIVAEEKLNFYVYEMKRNKDGMYLIKCYDDNADKCIIGLSYYDNMLSIMYEESMYLMETYFIKKIIIK